MGASTLFLLVSAAAVINSASATDVSDILRVLQTPGVDAFRAKGSSTTTGTSSNIVFDVGFNNGADTEFFLANGYRVVGVDANPALIEKGRAKLQRAEQEGRLFLANLALSLPTAPRQGHTQAMATQSHATFWVNDANDVGSSFDKAKCQSQGMCRPMNLSSIRCSALWAFGTPFYLKVDIEEFHYVCLEALLHLPAEFLPKYVSWELHEFQHLPYPLFDTSYIIKLYALGYTKIKQVIQNDKARSQFVMPDGAKHGFTESTEWQDVQTFLADGVLNPRDNGQAWCDFYMMQA